MIDKQTPFSQMHALLETKLRRPRLPSNLVRRERLFAQLDEGRSRALTLLSAPAGFGKTTLLCQWMAQLQARQQLPPTAWVSLEAEDNDPLRFWRYVIVACQRLYTDNASPYMASSHQGGAADNALSALDLLEAIQPPFTTSSSVEAALTLLLNTFADAPESLLVLEDYHVITNPQIHQSMAFLLDHLPETLHLFLVTRADPPLSLARLRANDKLCEVRTAELRFSAQEVALFMRQTTPFSLAEDDIKSVNERLDGWAAGLRLLALSLQQQSSPQGFGQALMAFSGSHHPLQAYFVNEVLALQPASIQDFLLRTSILGRVTAPLCDTLTNRDDSAQVLEMLEQTGLFLEALDEDGQWYRYHTLFAEAIVNVARRRLGEDTLHLLAHRASLWFEQQSMLPQAIEMSFHASDMARTVALIERFVSPLDAHSSCQPYRQMHEYHTLFRWLQRIPVATLKQSPTLCLSYATSLLFAAPPDQLDPRTVALVESSLRAAEAGLPETTPGWGLISALRALIYWRQDTLPQAALHARQALALLPAGPGNEAARFISPQERGKGSRSGNGPDNSGNHEILWRGIAETILGMEALFNGQLTLAHRIFQQSRALGERLFIRSCSVLPTWTWGKGMFTQTATTLLAWTCYQQGDLRLAAQYYQQVLSEAQETGESHTRLYALLGLASIAYEWNDLDQAERLAEEVALFVSQPGHQTSLSLRIQASLLIARIHHARGETGPALKLLVELPALVHAPLPPPLEQSILTEQIKLHLALGHMAIVQRWVSERPASSPEALPGARDELLMARFHFVQGNVQQAHALLLRLLAATPESEHSRIGLQIQAMLALTEAAHPTDAIEDHNRQIAAARQRLHTVLSLTQPQGYRRLFLDEREPMEKLLRSVASHLQEPSLKPYLQQLLQGFGVASIDLAPLSEPLSPQELRVLRLLASGSSAPQIAQQLVVSVTTVRTQIQSIYRKLQVNNRVAASSAARALNLL